MKISIYELLGMIKDGKAPKRIALRNEEYIYMEDARNYQCLTKPYEMMKIYDGWCLNDEVEILGTTLNTKDMYTPFTNKKIDKLEDIAFIDGDIGYMWTKTETKLKDKINEIIDKLNEE